MKKNGYVTCTILSLAVVIAMLISGCEWFNKKSDSEVTEQLIEFLNTRLPGSEFKTDPAESVVTPVEKNRYRINLKNSSFTSDLGWIFNFFYKDLSLDEMQFLAADTILIDDMSILYGPDNNFLSLQSLQGIKLTVDFPKTIREMKNSQFERFTTEKVRAEVGKIIFTNWDFDDIVKYKNKSSEVSTNNNGNVDKSNHIPDSKKLEPYSISVEQIKLEIEGVEKENGRLALLLEIGKVLNAKQGIEDPDVNLYLFKKDAPPPDLRKTLQRGLAINDLNIEAGNVEIAVKKFGVPVGGGTIENVTYSQFMKPDALREFFKFGHKIDLNHLKCSMIGKKQIGLWGDISQLKYHFTGEHVSPELAMAVIDTIKKSMELKNEADNPAMQDLTFLMMRFMTLIPQSKPRINFAISPFHHGFGELEANAEIRLNNLFSPDVKATVDIFKIDEILKKLNDANLLSPEDFKSMTEKLNGLLVKKENGDAAIIFEIKSDQPGMYFLNGKPVVIKRHGLFLPGM